MSPTVASETEMINARFHTRQGDGSRQNETDLPSEEPDYFDHTLVS